MTQKVYSSATKVGNVFKNADGTPQVKRIVLQDIAPTVKWLESITGLKLQNNLLGSAGKKASSGDLDIAVDQNTITKDSLIAKLVAVSDKACVKKSGISVHFKSPIKGDANNGYVQVDFMFVDDLEYAKFGMYSDGDASKFTGAVRNILMYHLAKSVSTTYKFSIQNGLIDTETNTVVSKDPDKIAEIVLGKGCSRSDANSVETIISAIKNNMIHIAYLKTVRDTSKNKNDVDAANSVLELITQPAHIV